LIHKLRTIRSIEVYYFAEMGFQISKIKNQDALNIFERLKQVAADSSI